MVIVLAIAIMHRATAEPIASDPANKALEAGDKMPAFAVNDPEDNTVALAGLLENGRSAIRGKAQCRNRHPEAPSPYGAGPTR